MALLAVDDLMAATGKVEDPGDYGRVIWLDFEIYPLRRVWTSMAMWAFGMPFVNEDQSKKA